LPGGGGGSVARAAGGPPDSVDPAPAPAQEEPAPAQEAQSAVAEPSAPAVDHPTAAAPTLRARPAAVSSVRSPRFAFAEGRARAFQCSLARKGGHAKFVRCSSPKRYHGLRNGTYVFRV